MFFYLFSFSTIFCSLKVFSAPHPVHSVFYLVLTFLNVSGLLFLIEADLLAFILLIVYVGAIAVLFLFVIIMLDLKRRPLFVRELLPVMPVAFFLCSTFLLQFVLTRNQRPIVGRSQGAWEQFNSFSTTIIPWEQINDSFSILNGLGQVLYTLYLFNFLAGGLVLLVALIGAIICVLPRPVFNTNLGVRATYPVIEQLRRRRESGSFLVSFDLIKNMQKNISCFQSLGSAVLSVKNYSNSSPVIKRGSDQFYQLITKKGNKKKTIQVLENSFTLFSRSINSFIFFNSSVINNRSIFIPQYQVKSGQSLLRYQCLDQKKRFSLTIHKIERATKNYSRGVGKSTALFNFLVNYHKSKAFII